MQQENQESGQDSRRIWGPAGWPWEMEILALVFVIIAIVVPYRLEAQIAQQEFEQDPGLIEMVKSGQTAPTEPDIGDAVSFLWAVAILGIYLGHLFISGAGISYLSTPVTYLISPVIFAGITYYRIYTHSHSKAVEDPIVTGSPLEILAIFVGVIFACTLIARLRMLRHGMRFRSVKWDITTPAPIDSTTPKQMVLEGTPLIYPARRYRACPDGVLIEGWLYLFPIGFRHVRSVENVKQTHHLMRASHFASSSKRVIQLQMDNQREPILISPQDHEDFLRYCEQHAAVRMHVAG